MTLLVEDPIPTRYTLLSRLEDRGDQDSWKDFFDTYWRLIYSVALKSGLTEAEAQDVVQETIISVARDIQNSSATARWVRSRAGCATSSAGALPTSCANAPAPCGRTIPKPVRTCRDRTWRTFPTRPAKRRNPSGRRNGRPTC